MHTLDGIEVARRDENEITWNRFGLGQCTGGPFGAARDWESTVLHGRQKGLLLFEAEEIDLVDVKHALVSTMNGSGLHTVVGRRFHPAGLERVVAYIAQE